MSFAWIVDLLSGSGHAFTAQWWNNLLDGLPNPVSRPEVLKCIAQQANIDPGYLTHPDPRRDGRIEAELELIGALSAKRSLLWPGSAEVDDDTAALRRIIALLRTPAFGPHKSSNDQYR